MTCKVCHFFQSAADEEAESSSEDEEEEQEEYKCRSGQVGSGWVRAGWGES